MTDRNIPYKQRIVQMNRIKAFISPNFLPSFKSFEQGSFYRRYLFSAHSNDFGVGFPLYQSWGGFPIQDSGA